MTTLSAVAPLSPLSQVEQVFFSIGSLLWSLAQRTDAVFQRVTISKKNPDGTFKIYDVKKEDGKVEKVDKLIYVQDITTGDLYLGGDDALTIRIKCALIAIFMPFYTVSSMAWHLSKSLFEISALAINTIDQSMGHLLRCQLRQSGQELLKGFSPLPAIAGRAIFDIAKAPFFGLGCEFAAIYGLFRPYHGRKFEALIENAWQRGASYKQDLREIPARQGESCREAFLKDIQQSNAFYVAQCFQVRGNIYDHHIQVISSEPLN